MAYIDKIYGTIKQWHLLHDFISKNKPEYINDYLYNIDHLDVQDLGNEDIPLSNFSHEANVWLWENCKLDFVIERLKFQYGKKGPCARNAK